MLSVEDFLGMEIKPNMEDYLAAVAEVARLKFMYDEEDDLVAEQDEEFCINKQQNITRNIQSLLASFPVTNNVDHQEEPPLVNFVVPKARRSILPNVRRRTFTEKFILIKNAVENPQVDNNKIHLFIPQVGCEQGDIYTNLPPTKVGRLFLTDPRLEKENPREQTERVIKISFQVGASFVARKELPQKRPRKFSNEESFRADNLCKRSTEEKQEAIIRKKKKVKRVVEAPAVNYELPRELPANFRDRIIGLEGSVESAVLVIEKNLFEADVLTGQGRFSIPLRQVKNQFLKQEEYEYLRPANKTHEIRVVLIEPSLELCKINLRKWIMKKNNGKVSSSYVLVTTWNHVRRRNNLRAGNLVQLWAFRKASDELCFALVRVN